MGEARHLVGDGGVWSMGDASLDASHQASTYQRIELITGDARRRRWTAEEKAAIVAESLKPGAQVSEIARRHGVNRGLVWTWRRQARQQFAGSEPGFVPVRIVDAPAPATPGTPAWHQTAAMERRPDKAAAGSAIGSIDIEMDGVRVRVTGPADAAALRQVLAYLGRPR